MCIVSTDSIASVIIFSVKYALTYGLTLWDVDERKDSLGCVAFDMPGPNGLFEEYDEGVLDIL